MSGSVKVSVVIPVYNMERHLKECLDSVIGQTLQEIEVICVDDGSVDASNAIIKEYCSRDDRVKLIRQENAGTSVASNRGFESAVGEYIYFVDHDDVVVEDALEFMYCCSVKSDLDILCFESRPIFDWEVSESEYADTVKRTVRSKEYTGIRKGSAMFVDMIANSDFKVPLWRYCYKRSFLEKSGVRFLNGVTFQDELFSFESLLKAERVAHATKVCYYHRYAENTVTSSAPSMFKCRLYFAIYLEMLKFIRDNRLTDDVKAAALRYANAIRNGALRMLQGGHQPVVEEILGIKYRNYDYYKNISPENYYEEAKNQYRRIFGKELNLIDPKLFNEKIFWIKILENDKRKTELTDKYLVREFVKERVGEDYLVPLIGVYESFEEIDFAALPQKFVIKATHGSAMNLVVRNKDDLDIEEAKLSINKWLSTNYAFVGLEPHYSDIKPRIIIEEYLENQDGDLDDYKIWCFDGKPHYIQFLSNRSVELKSVFFDCEWKRAPFVQYRVVNEEEVEKPSNLKEMLDAAQKLSDEFNFVRVDLYRLNDGTLKFGEMTFTPANGQHFWNPPEYNEIIGALLHLDPDRLASLREWCIEKEMQILKKRETLLTDAVLELEKAAKQSLDFINDCQKAYDRSLDEYDKKLNLLAKEKDQMIVEKKQLLLEIESLRAAVNEITGSSIFMVGRIITYIPRKVKRFIERIRR